MGKFLQNLELKGTLGEHVVLVNGYANRGYDFTEIIIDSVVCDGAFASAPTMLGVHGMREMPFYV